MGGLVVVYMECSGIILREASGRRWGGAKVQSLGRLLVVAVGRVDSTMVL